jgi:FdhE protein
MMRSREERRLLLQRRLQDSQIDERGLRVAADFYAALIRRQIDADVPIAPLALDKDGRRAKWMRGEPVLAGEAIGFDSDVVRALLLDLCATGEQFAQPAESRVAMPATTADTPAVAPAPFAGIRSAIESQTLDFDALLDHVLQGHTVTIAAMAREAKVDGDLLLALTRFALRPALQACASALAGSLRAGDLEWQRGTCPLCGAPPLLSEYRDQDQSRHLRCSACGSTWLFPRLQCPACGNSEFRTLKTIRLAGWDSRTIDACDRCHRYLKALNATDPTPVDLLPLEDLLSVHLDAAARAQGYRSIVG